MFKNTSNVQIDDSTFNDVAGDQHLTQINLSVVPGGMIDLSLYSAHLRILTPRLPGNDQLPKLARWISPLDFNEQQNAALGKRTEGTGTWLLQSSEFKGWVDGESKVLWCPGKRGFFDE